MFLNQMNKKEALIILINHSFLLSDEVKKQLLSKVDSMDENQIDVLGKFLAEEKSKSIESVDEVIKEYQELILHLESSQK